MTVNKPGMLAVGASASVGMALTLMGWNPPPAFWPFAIAYALVLALVPREAAR